MNEKRDQFDCDSWENIYVFDSTNSPRGPNFAPNL